VNENWAAEFKKLRGQSGVVAPALYADPTGCVLFKRLVASINEFAIFLLDPEGHILTWNQGATRIKQYTEAEVLGHHFGMLYTEEDQRAGRPEKNLGDALQFGQTEDIGWRRKKDGSWFWADAVITVIRDDDGKLFGFGKVIRDLTEVTKAFSQAKTLEVNQRVDRLKDQFLSLVSHELRTPLTTIKGFADLVEDGTAGPMTPEQSAYMGSVLKATESLTNQINDLIDMTSFQARPLHLDLSLVNFSEIVEGVVFAAQIEAQGKHLWIANHVSPDLAGIEADAHRVSQILMNIVTNAIKFTPERGRIEISGRIDANELRCEVTDTGKGISPDALENLFKQFSQADMSATRASGGLGIGLYISKTLVEAHGGKIGVSSAEGKGSTFWFTLPRKAVVTIEQTPTDAGTHRV
jgi:PAS domain S-box-containing protein